MPPRAILQKTHHLFDDDVAALKRASILLGSHVISADGHLKAPRRILTRERMERGKCVLAFLGCAGFLLKPLRLCESESGKAYLEGMRDVLGIRMESGLPPPHIIVDNPPLIEGRIQILVKDIWGDAHQDSYLEGGPIHRKIEFKEKCDKTHQDMPDAEHDYSYCLMRFGFLPPESNGCATKEAEDRLRAATESLFKNLYDLRGGRTPRSTPDNAKAWKQKPTSACYLKRLRARHPRGRMIAVTRSARSSIRRCAVFSRAAL